MKLILSIISILLTLNASTTSSLNLEEALSILKNNNLEIKAADMDVLSAKEEEKTVTGKHWGKLDFVQDFARSNDAGNVFGFKLTSREATFGDFGFGASNMPAQTDPAYLTTPPNTLNYPDDRNFFQTKLRYEVPLFTGFALTSYADIMKAMTKMKSLEKDEVINEKIYQLRKSFYNMKLLNDSIDNLTTILNNIEKLEDTTQNMIDVGYAKKIDLLEVKAKKGNVTRLLMHMNSNKKLLYHYISFLLNEEVNEITTPDMDVQLPLLSDEEVLSANLDIQKASTGLTIRKNMLDSSKAAYYPTVGAFGELSTADDSFLGDASDHKAYTVGARLTWNLFNGGIDSSKIQKSKIEQMKMQSQVELAKNGIALKLAKTRTEIETADEEIASLKKELDLASAIYENYEGRYKEKLSSMNDVIIKQSQQIEKILQLQVAKNTRNEKIFALEKLANQGK
jgi:outer membrane protein TolC